MRDGSPAALFLTLFGQNPNHDRQENRELTCKEIKGVTSVSTISLSEKKTICREVDTIYPI